MCLYRCWWSPAGWTGLYFHCLCFTFTFKSTAFSYIHLYIHTSSFKIWWKQQIHHFRSRLPSLKNVERISAHMTDADDLNIWLRYQLYPSPIHKLILKQHRKIHIKQNRRKQKKLKLWPMEFYSHLYKN